MKIEKAPHISEVRRLANETIYQINEQNAYANLALEKGLKNSDLSQVDKSLVTEIVNGTMRMIKHLDWVLNSFLKKDITTLNPWVKNILRLSLYQIMFMDKIPAYAIVNDAVEIAKAKTNNNMAKLVNGVLRNVLRNLDNITYPEANTSEYLAVYYSHPEWLVEMLLKNYTYLECEEILKYNNQRPIVQLRGNILKTNRDDLINSLAAEGVICEPNNYLPMAVDVKELNIALANTKAYQEGYFYIQNAASMLATLILDPKPHELVYDLCSGVGGKTTHLAEIMNNQGNIISYDIYQQKLIILNDNANRLGITIITTKLADVLNIEPEPAKLADKVLLDVPCSGLGVLNRRSDLRWNKNEDNLEELTKLQYNLLVKASQLVKVGGYLLYATCTINPAENEEIVNAFLQKYSNFVLVPFRDNSSFFPFSDQDLERVKKGMVTIIPGKYKTDGMFYALLMRKELV